MPDIQVWKCKRTWLMLSHNERSAILVRLSYVLRRQSVECYRDVGPFLVHDGEDSCLLIFGREPRGTTELIHVQEYLAGYFEPLATVGRRSPFTPRTLADRLQKRPACNSPCSIPSGDN